MGLQGRAWSKAIPSSASSIEEWWRYELLNLLLPRERLNVGKQVAEVDVRVRCVKCQEAILACTLLLVECIVDWTSYPFTYCSHTCPPTAECAEYWRVVRL